MKKLNVLFLSACMLMMTVCTNVFAETQEVQVTTPDELYQALEDDSIEAVCVSADIELTMPMITISKDVTIAADVIYHPTPDDGFFVKSLMVADGGTLTVTGKLTTQHTFEEGFAIAQVYVNGGTFDVSAGTVSDDCNICFNAGTVIAPEGGFGEGVEIARYLYNDVNEDAILAAFAEDVLRNVTVQAECELTKEIVIPEGKHMTVSALLTVADGAGITGDYSIDPGEGLILEGSAYVNDIAVPENASKCLVLGGEDGAEVIEILPDLKTWLDAEGSIEKCALIVTVGEFLNPAYAAVTDDSGSVNLFGVIVEGEVLPLAEAGLEEGDTLLLVNPQYNTYEGNVEMVEPMLVNLKKAGE